MTFLQDFLVKLASQLPPTPINIVTFNVPKNYGGRTGRSAYFRFGSKPEFTPRNGQWLLLAGRGGSRY